MGRAFAPASLLQLPWFDFRSPCNVCDSWHRFCKEKKIGVLGRSENCGCKSGLSFTGKDTDVQRGRVICLGLHSCLVSESGLGGLPSPCCMARGGERNPERREKPGKRNPEKREKLGKGNPKRETGKEESGHVFLSLCDAEQDGFLKHLSGHRRWYLLVVTENDGANVIWLCGLSDHQTKIGSVCSRGFRVCEAAAVSQFH